MGRDAHVAAAVLEGAAITALQVHDAEAVLEADGQHLTVHGEQVILRVALVMPVVVASAPLELLGLLGLACGPNVVIKLS